MVLARPDSSLQDDTRGQQNISLKTIFPRATPPISGNRINMRAFAVKSLAVIAAYAAAAAASCIGYNGATTVANNYASIFSDYSTSLAKKVLASDFQDQSDSVISLINNGTTCPDAVCCIL